MNKEIAEKIKVEMKNNLKAFGKTNKELIDELNLETIDSLNYLKMCFYESLRIEPPVPISSMIFLTEDQVIDGLYIKSTDLICINTE
jgi:cytochrome P450